MLSREVREKPELRRDSFASSHLLRTLRTQPVGLAALLAGITALLGLGLLVGRLLGVLSAGHWLIDPNSLADQPRHFGFFSNLGIFLWTAAGAVSTFTGFVLRRATGNSAWTRLLLWGGLLTLVLAIDDLLMLHDGLIPHMQIGDVEFYTVYGLAAAWVLYDARHAILRAEWLLLLGGLLGFVSSALVDFAGEYIWFGQIGNRIEDIFKFGGLLFWSAFFLRTAHSALRRSLG